MESHLEKICEVCGSDSVGFQHLVATCSQCSSTREHLYCMQFLRFELSEDWICDSCLTENEMNLVESGGKEDTLMSSSNIARHDTNVSSRKRFSKSNWQFHSKKQKPVETGKVKFIDQEAVIALASGAASSESPIKTNMSSRSGQSNVMASLCQKNPTKARTGNPMSFPDRVEKATAAIHSGPSMPSRDGAVNKSLRIDKKVPQTLKETKALERTSLGSGKRRAHQKQLIDVYFPPKDVEASRDKRNNFTEKSSRAHLSPRPNDPENMRNVAPVSVSENKKFETSSKKIETELAEEAQCPQLRSSNLPSHIDAGGNTNDVAEDNHSNVEAEELLNMQHAIGLYRTFLPSQLITWKGGFSIVDSTRSEVIEGFQAQPPCRVHCKAFEISQKMPPVLQVKMLPRLHDSADLFRDSGADLADIALYFFSSVDNTGRAREMHNELFEHMEIQRSIMIGYVNDIELLIFTSKQLNVDFQTAFSSKAKKFFWGVFRKRQVSNAKSFCEVNEKPPTMLSPLACAYPDDQEIINATVSKDMEIDMVGGDDVGTIDVVVQKDSSTCPSNKPIPTKGNPADKQIVVQQRSLEVKPEPKTKDHDKSSGSTEAIKHEPVLEDTKFIASWRRLQELCLGFSPDHIANAPPGFPEKTTGSSLGIKSERN